MDSDSSSFPPTKTPFSFQSFRYNHTYPDIQMLDMEHERQSVCLFVYVSSHLYYFYK